MSDTAGTRSDAIVDQLLLEADLDGDGQLRPALLQLRALGTVAPEPSADVAALLRRAEDIQATRPVPLLQATRPAPLVQAAPSPAEPAPAPRENPVDELAARRRAKRRVTLTALSVAASLSAGVAVAAASDQGIRDSFSTLHQAVTSFVTGSGPAPAGDQADEPAATVPAPAAPATVPTAPPAAGHPTQAPASDVPAATQATEAATPGGAAGLPAAKDLASAVPEDLTKGMGQQPQVPVPGPSDLPLPETLPEVPLR